MRTSDSSTVRLVGIAGVVADGHGVASGKSAGSPFPKGTIEMQIPVFQRLGLDLSWAYPATLNISVAPKRIRITRPWHVFSDVRWFEDWPPESFSFSTCAVEYGDTRHRAVIYYPHEETRTDHFQEPSIVEVLASHISDIKTGSEVTLWVDPTQVTVE
ncbi:MAG: hypothetical protein O7B77_08265 [Actinobacteria bacterium]|nr:hypothetical protein [Actinomycetota bacterium]